MSLEELQCDSGEEMSLPGLPSIARLKVKKLWVWVTFLCWVGVHETPCNCVRSYSSGVPNHLEVFQPHFTFLFWLCFAPCPGFIVVLSREEQRKIDLPCPVWKQPSLLIIGA